MRLAIAFGAAVTAAFGSAIALALLDLYLAGHGRPTLDGLWIEWPEFGVSLSRRDVIMVVVTVVTGVAGWVATGRHDRKDRP